ncbi:DUF6152 family protein [Variovorax sp. 22077]|uniref:DUF6152 family protein n=1 Tax=Variovorax sp. 22077 TaxID=3453867 RepID=UPI003F870EB6
MINSLPSPLSRRKFCLMTFVACGVLPSAAAAHHSFAIFDQTQTTKIKGVVGRFAWTNPHVTIYIDAPGPPPQRFKIETGSVNALKRTGWRSDSIKEGESAEVSFHPLKSGDLGGLLIEIKVASGTLTGGG